MMKLYLMKMRSIHNLKYIFKKREIIRLTSFVLIFALLGGISLVHSEELEKHDSGIDNIPLNKEVTASILEEAVCFPLGGIALYAPALLLEYYMGLDAGVPVIKNSDTDDAQEVLKAGIDSEAVAKKTIAANNDDKALRIAYLTFDDGLDRKVTPQILDILKKYEIKATFFILGNSISKNKDILKRMVDEGHSIGNHTYTHKKDIIYTDVKNFSDELARTSKAIYEAVGINTKLFRPPYGAPYIRSPEYKAALAQHKIVLWNVDSMDSRIKGITSNEIVATVINQLKNKNKPIILFHSTSAREETAKALPEIIEYLIANGYSISKIE